MMLCCAEQPRLKESSTCVLQMWFKSVDFIGQWLPSLSRNKCRWGKCDLWCWLQPAERHRLLCSLAWWVMTYKEKALCISEKLKEFEGAYWSERIDVWENSQSGSEYYEMNTSIKHHMVLYFVLPLWFWWKNSSSKMVTIENTKSNTE